MLDIAQLTANPLLVAGIGTTLVASLAMQGRAVFGAARGFVRGQFVSTLTARANGTAVARLAALVGRHRLHASAAAYSVAEDETLTIGYGDGVARWRGVWIWYRLWIDTSVKCYDTVEVLDLTFLTRDRAVIDAFMGEALRVDRQRDTIDVHHRKEGRWLAVSRKKRPLSTVFANAGLKAELVDKIAWFLANEAWYARRGLAYKLVVLLHGQPGTGKSSLIQALASHFGRDLYCVDSLFAIGPEIGRFANGILAIEDVDTLGVLSREAAGSPSREPSRPDEPAVARQVAGVLSGSFLHGLLNTLDGLATPHGLITILTTNHVEALDPAMVRPCRIDVMREVVALDYEAFCEMFASYFGDAAPALPREAYRPQTGALLQEVLMTAASPQAAEAAVARLAAPMRAAA